MRPDYPSSTRKGGAGTLGHSVEIHTRPAEQPLF